MRAVSVPANLGVADSGAMGTFYEFFAGGGMTRAGLGPGWICLFANDFDAAKAKSYRANWGDGDFRLGDIATLAASDLPGQADLAWASFPCQDLSLAGKGGGLGGARSGTFWRFRDLLRGLAREGRAPSLVAAENVCGLLTSNGGADFSAVVGALVDLGYRVGAMVIDAERFTPQSRPRLFIVGVARELAMRDLIATEPVDWTTMPALRAAHARLPNSVAARWVWWRLPEPPRRNAGLRDVIEDEPTGVAWREDEETRYLLSLMSDANREKLRAAQRSGEREVGAVYRRTRRDENGARVQRAEVRFDNLAGCLRTPAGGSSRQTLLVVEGKRVRSRLISPRECARLMGLSDDYILPKGATDAFHLLGDGVVAPVVRHLAEHLFEPLLKGAVGAARIAAE
ncbi:DNA cytosine methyltransferase [Terrarubrum flagellatum]|uniref:DNA cytosine methyltransferase n=1 Tax=Terrirubrum flagellatum TaxID=2895980 RepID=UPI0031451974